MADSFLPYQNPTTTDKKLDSEQTDFGGGDYRERERIQIAGALAAAIAKVQNTDPGSSDYALTVRDVLTPAIKTAVEKLQFDSDGDLKVVLADTNIALKHLINILSRQLSIDPSTSRQRVLLDAITASLTLAAVTTVTTVTTVTSVSQLAGFDVKQTLLYATERNNWSNSVRARIT